jgi:hypothetical protein
MIFHMSCCLEAWCPRQLSGPYGQGYGTTLNIGLQSFRFFSVLKEYLDPVDALRFARCHRRNCSIFTGDIRNQIDRIWDAFWSGGISNPLEVMEQITYLLFLRRLDDLQTLEENKSARLGRPIERRIFPEGNDPRGKLYAQLRW